MKALTLKETALKEEIKEILEELENMYEISELEEQVNNINKIRDYIINLQQENKKQKEVIDKAIKHVNKYESIKAFYEYIDEDVYDEYNYDEDFKSELLDILNEVTNNE